jgi:DNA-binding NarL/FixJ family response regulator
MKPVPPIPIRIAVVESDPLRFLGFRTILSQDPTFQIRASTIPEIVNGGQRDVILITANHGSGFTSAMAAVKTVLPSARILVTGAGQQDEDILKALFAGAKGYIREEASPDEFKQAIRVVHGGSVWAPRRLLATFIERVTSPSGKPVADQNTISERERAVLRLLVAGRSNREVGAELGILERTVKSHVTQLMRKVGVRNRTELSVHALTRSLLANR